MEPGVAVRCCIIGGGIVAMLWQPARADDTMAEVGAGGLVFLHAARIAMQREDLTLRPTEVHVRYEMRNESMAPIVAHVAFPLPPIDQGSFQHGDNGLSIFIHEPIDFMKFRLTVDGHSVRTHTRVWATIDGRDATDAMRDAGLDVRTSVVAPYVDSAHQGALQRVGAFSPDGWPLWQTHVAYEWNQAFRPGVTVVEHSYQPFAGLAYIDNSSELSQFCRVSDEAKQDVMRLIDSMPPKQYVAMTTVSFVLTTAQNWEGPIGTFHITLQTQAPEDVAVLCEPGLALRRTGPTNLEASVSPWIASHDVTVLFVSKRFPKLIIPDEESSGGNSTGWVELR